MSDTQYQCLEIQRYLYISAVALTFYDFLLKLDDEVRYAWNNKRFPMFYLYLMYRVLLFGYQFWHIYFVVRSLDSPEPISTIDRIFQVIAITIFWIFSDAFVTVRIYAISSGNKILAAYLTTLALARITFAITGYLTIGGIVLENAALSNSIVFDFSVVIAVVWYAYRGWGAFKFSALLRVIVSQVAIYITFMTLLLIFSPIALNLLGDIHFESIIFGLLGLINPALTMRFLLWLRKTADPHGEQQSRFTALSSLRAAPFSDGD